MSLNLCAIITYYDWLGVAVAHLTLDINSWFRPSNESNQNLVSALTPVTILLFSRIWSHPYTCHNLSSACVGFVLWSTYHTHAYILIDSLSITTPLSSKLADNCFHTYFLSLPFPPSLTPSPISILSLSLLSLPSPLLSFPPALPFYSFTSASREVHSVRLSLKSCMMSVLSL